MCIRTMVLFGQAIVLVGLLTAPASARAAVTSVAVLDVSAQGRFDSEAVAGLADVVAAEAARRPLRVMSRADLAALVGYERQKQLLGCDDASCLAEIGGALGVDYLLATQVARVGGVWLVTMTLLDAKGRRPAVRAQRRANEESALIDAAIDAVGDLLSDEWLEPLLPPRPQAPKVLAVSGGVVLAAGLVLGGLGLWHHLEAKSAGSEEEFRRHRDAAAWQQPTGDVVGVLGAAALAGGLLWMKLSVGAGGDAPGFAIQGRF